MAHTLKLLTYMEYIDYSLCSNFEYSCVLVLQFILSGTGTVCLVTLCISEFRYIATYLVICSFSMNRTIGSKSAFICKILISDFVIFI